MIQPTCHDWLPSAMYRPTSAGGARSATNGPWTIPCRHSPNANAITASAIRPAAARPLNHVPATPISTIAAAQITPIAASARIRRRPSPSFAIGSCASTTTSELIAHSNPICFSVTPA